MSKIEDIFEGWSSKRLSDKSRIHQAEVILKVADSLKDLTADEKRIIKEAEDFLLDNE